MWPARFCVFFCPIAAKPCRVQIGRGKNYTPGSGKIVERVGSWCAVGESRNRVPGSRAGRPSSPTPRVFSTALDNVRFGLTAGEMMMSLLWYYRPEHTKQGRQKEDMPDELFASKHRDVNSVACIDDRCYVLTFNEYCRSVPLVFRNVGVSKRQLCRRKPVVPCPPVFLTSGERSSRPLSLYAEVLGYIREKVTPSFGRTAYDDAPSISIVRRVRRYEGRTVSVDTK